MGGSTIKKIGTMGGSEFSQTYKNIRSMSEIRKFQKVRFVDFFIVTVLEEVCSQILPRFYGNSIF